MTATSHPAAAGSTARLIPVDDDIDTGGFFEAARRGVLAVRRCNSCDAVLHMPRMYCRHCGSWIGRWQEVAPSGRLYSWTTVTHQVHPAYLVPYTVVVVDLDDFPGTRFVGSLQGAPALQAGDRMVAYFDEVGEVDGRMVVMPNWRVAV
jgi:uncharacterized OB-fold protein